MFLRLWWSGIRDIWQHSVLRMPGNIFFGDFLLPISEVLISLNFAVLLEILFQRHIDGTLTVKTGRENLSLCVSFLQVFRLN